MFLRVVLILTLILSGVVCEAGKYLPTPPSVTNIFGEVIAENEAIRIQSLRSLPQAGEALIRLRSIFSDFQFQSALTLPKDFNFSDMAEEFNLYSFYNPDTVDNLINAVIVDKETDQVAGVFFIVYAMDSTTARIAFKADSAPVIASIGYGLAPEFRGKGLATRAVNLVVTKLRHLNMRLNIYASVLDFNKPSKSVLQRNGFTFRQWSDDEFNGVPLCVYMLEP